MQKLPGGYAANLQDLHQKLKSSLPQISQLPARGPLSGFLPPGYCFLPTAFRGLWDWNFLAPNHS